VSVLLTARFKSATLPALRSETINTALEEYTRVYAFLVDRCRENLATIEVGGTFRDRYNETSMRKLKAKEAGKARMQPRFS
jgi:hypothetical protein